MYFGDESAQRFSKAYEIIVADYGWNASVVIETAKV